MNLHARMLGENCCRLDARVRFRAHESAPSKLNGPANPLRRTLESTYLRSESSDRTDISRIGGPAVSSTKHADPNGNNPLQESRQPGLIRLTHIDSPLCRYRKG